MGARSNLLFLLLYGLFRVCRKTVKTWVIFLVWISPRDTHHVSRLEAASNNRSVQYHAVIGLPCIQTKYKHHHI
jgi:hypothetical protein